ncbi:MAG: hypothetical protein ACREOB_11870 [Thermodesulfobacteriota bacterium]
MAKKKNEVSDLKKARDHFIRATTEWIIGSGFALKGMKNLLMRGGSRKLVYDVAATSIKRGFNLMTNVADILKSQQERKTTRRKTRGKKTRKIKVE